MTKKNLLFKILCFSLIFSLSVSNSLVSFKAETAEIMPPNEAGEIMVLMYHGLDKVKQSAPYMRTIEGFKHDLESLYVNGFRPISASDYANNTIKVEKGFAPVLITFDDGISSSFSLVEQEGEFVPTKDCAVDIMNKFAEKHPDFGKAAVFFINGTGRITFGQTGTLEQRLNYLIDSGYDLGNHTYSHPMLSKLNGTKIQEEMAKLEKIVNDAVPNYKMECMAYPFGDRPVGETQKYILKGEYDGVSYDYKIAFRASPSGRNTTLNNIGFDKYNTSRVRGTDCEQSDLGWQIKQYIKNPEFKYISDGDPNVISVPVKNVQKIDTSTFSDKLTLNIY